MLGDHAPGDELRITDHLGDRIDRPHNHSRGGEEFDQRVARLLGSPLGDQLVELVLVLATRTVCGETGVGAEFGPAHRRAQPGEHGVLIRADDNKRAVSGGVDVRRRDAGQPGARGPTDHATLVVIGDRRFLDRQACLVQSRVDDLALPGDGAAVQRCESAVHGEHPCQGVAQ